MLDVDDRAWRLTGNERQRLRVFAQCNSVTLVTESDWTRPRDRHAHWQAIIWALFVRVGDAQGYLPRFELRARRARRTRCTLRSSLLDLDLSLLDGSTKALRQHAQRTRHSLKTRKTLQDITPTPTHAIWFSSSRRSPSLSSPSSVQRSSFFAFSSQFSPLTPSAVESAL